MRDFRYHRPGSLDEAVELMRGCEEPRLLAGGQSLLPLMKLDLTRPSDVISLRDVAELKGIRRDGDTLEIGAAATHDAVHRSEEVRSALPALAELAGRIGDPQVRNRGTIGGSVAHADPAADYPAALVALDATVITQRREIPAEEFFQGMFATALEEGEIVTAIRFPLPEAACYAKFANPASKYAVVGVMVARTGGGVRVAVTGAGPGVFRVPEMEAALSADFSPGALDGIPVDASDLVSDDAAGADYRAHLVTVMARRAVAGCA